MVVVTPGLEDQVTPLHLAARHTGSCEIVKELLDLGANIASLDAFNRTPLIHALMASHADVAALLLQEGRTQSGIAGKDPVYALALACGAIADESIIRTLLDLVRTADPSMQSLDVHHSTTNVVAWVSYK